MGLQSSYNEEYSLLCNCFANNLFNYRGAKMEKTCVLKYGGKLTKLRGVPRNCCRAKKRGKRQSSPSKCAAYCPIIHKLKGCDFMCHFDHCKDRCQAECGGPPGPPDTTPGTDLKTDPTTEESGEITDYY